MTRLLAAVAVSLLLATGCTSGQGWKAHPATAPDSTVETDVDADRFFSESTQQDCFVVTAWRGDGLSRSDVTLGTFCRAER